MDERLNADRRRSDRGAHRPQGAVDIPYQPVHHLCTTNPPVYNESNLPATNLSRKIGALRMHQSELRLAERPESLAYRPESLAEK